MSTDETLRSEIDTVARPATRPRYWPRRLRILRRLGMIALAGLMLGIFTAGVVRTVRMIGLPDVGDPFADLNEARAQARAAAQARPRRNDAVEFYRRAIAALKPLNDQAVGARYNPNTSWSNALQAVQQWRGRNDEALRLFREGSEVDVTLPPPEIEPFGFNSDSPLLNNRFFNLLWLAILEGSRLEDQGDLAGAWSWYRAFLQGTSHIDREAGVSSGLVGSAFRTRFGPRIRAWAEDPRTTAALLRRALADVEACRAMQPSEIDALADQYRTVIFEIGRGQWTQPHPDQRPHDRVVPQPLAYLWWQGLRFLDNEPERSRRVIRLAFANWRAWLATPEAIRPRPAIRAVVLRNSRMPQSLEFYPVGPGAPPAARRVSPQHLGEWFGTTRDAKFPLAAYWSNFQRTRRQDRAAHRSLVIHLAEQLYEREYGSLPDKPEMLVGTVLKSLPDDGSSEFDDGTTPTVEFP